MSAGSARAGAAKDDYGPSLPELLGPRLRALRAWQRLALALVVALVVALGIALAVRSAGAVETYHQSADDARARGLPAIPFHFDYSKKMRRTRPPGTYVSVERRVRGTLAGRFTVRELRIGRQPGLVSGYMPIVAERYERAAAERFDSFRLQFEGRGRVNSVEGYQFAFTARLERPGAVARQLFGRIVMLPQPYDAADLEKPFPPGKNAEQGLLIEMLATTLDKVPSATRVGDEGILQRPFRSFRFGE